MVWDGQGWPRMVKGVIDSQGRSGMVKDDQRQATKDDISQGWPRVIKNNTAQGWLLVKDS